jgi:hypothetical protein
MSNETIQKYAVYSPDRRFFTLLGLFSPQKEAITPLIKLERVRFDR